MPVEFSKLNSSSILSLPPDQTVFFFPVGILEDHGPHLPVGLDLFEAEKMCKLTAEQIESELKGWSTVIMPSASFGVEGNSSDLSVNVRPHVLRDWLVDCCRSLKKQGFRHFVCYSGNFGPKQLTTIEEAGKIVGRKILAPISKSSLLLSASSAIVHGKEDFGSPLWPDPKEHGGERDTSVALFVSPDQVDPSFQSLPQRALEGGRLSRWVSRVLRKTRGYWGNAASGTKEKGDRIVRANIETVLPLLKEVLQGAKPRSKFRSWYSVLPPNKSFFKAWILFFLCVAVASLWIFFSIDLVRFSQ